MPKTRRSSDVGMPKTRRSPDVGRQGLLTRPVPPAGGSEDNAVPPDWFPATALELAPIDARFRPRQLRNPAAAIAYRPGTFKSGGCCSLREEVRHERRRGKDPIPLDG